MLVSPMVDAGLAGIFGLLIGSFLNVVIFRLPQMLERQWAAECAELTGKPAPDGPVVNLVTPRSRCRQCGHLIRWYENVPVLSYLALRGKCSACAAPIGLRYPLVELVTGALFAFSVWHWGATPYVLSCEAGDLVARRRNVELWRFAAADGRIVGTRGYHAGEELHVVRREDGSVSHLDVGTFILTREPYEPGAPIPGGHPPTG